MCLVYEWIKAKCCTTCTCSAFIFFCSDLHSATCVAESFSCDWRFCLISWSSSLSCVLKSICSQSCACKKVEQCLTAHQTHYRSYWEQVCTGQMTQWSDDPTNSVKARKDSWRKMGSTGFNPTRSTLPCYNNTTHMQYEKSIKCTNMNTNESRCGAIDPGRQNPIQTHTAECSQSVINAL